QGSEGNKYEIFMHQDFKNYKTKSSVLHILNYNRTEQLLNTLVSFLCTSLIAFFNKMQKWADMANLPQEFRERTEKLERNFAVSAVIFKKYEPIFRHLFKDPQEEPPPRQQRGRKQRRQPCTVSEVFNFCWVLFVQTKGNFPMISDDLVNSYHLLLCALDLVFGNALLCSNRRDLLNATFKGLPEDFGNKDYKPPSEPPCIIDDLCSLHDGLELEAKGIKQHYWKPYIRKLFERKRVGFISRCLWLLFPPSCFSKAINKAYEEYVLTVGNLDERIFLGDDADEEIGTSHRCLSSMSNTETVERLQVKHNLQHHFQKSKAHTISTPLTGRRYMKESNPCATPISSATQCVSRLHAMLMGLKNAPSERLLQIFRSCSGDPTLPIAHRVKQMGEVFCHHYTQSTKDHSGYSIDYATKYLWLAEILYYKVLEAVIEQEKRRLGEIDLTVSGILQQDIFHRSLLACCLEIVIFSYKPPGDFMWIMDIFDLPPYHFYKVIEVLIRAEDGLFREVVKRLNHIEETILENMAWKQDSPLWDGIKNAENKVPTCEEVMPSYYFENAEHTGSSLPSSPLPHARLKEVRADGSRKDTTASPTTLHDRYSSPNAGSARRRLFADADTTLDSSTNSMRVSQHQAGSVVPVQSVTAEAVPVTHLPRQTLVTMATATVTATIIPVQGRSLHIFPINTSHSQVPFQQVSLPKKTGSIALVFRKVYHLASVRLRHLCAKLDISDDLRSKIWTCFEYTLVNCTDLMTDRHLDQLLMCAIYIMAKVTKEDQSFQNIMHSYRTQPQASSNVCETTLLPFSDSCIFLCDDKSHSGSDHTPECLLRPDREEERGDLIQFYNNIYIRRVKAFALKYSASNLDNGGEASSLSPFPSVRMGSPRRVLLSQHHSIYISPHKNGGALSPREKMFYCFSRSPSKRLRDINSMIKSGETPTKKRGFSLDDGSELPAKRICQENHPALLRRLQDVANDRGSH
uniref:RB transcriptional corepressor like 2 n=1 Tax=Callorhinchus milii TaxID=7868 RepID=A0A4W3JG46_CALMI